MVILIKFNVILLGTKYKRFYLREMLIIRYFLSQMSNKI